MISRTKVDRLNSICFIAGLGVDSAVEKMELPEKVKEHALGIVSASLWQWYHS